MPSDLEIRIRSIADDSGIRLTDEALQKVLQRTLEMEKATGQLTDATSSERDALKGRAQDALAQIAVDEKWEQQKKRSVGTSSELSKELGVLRQAGRGVSSVFAGLAQHDLPGLIEAARGFTEIGHAMTEGLTQIGAGFARGSVFVGPFIAAIGILNDKAKENTATIKRYYDEIAQGQERFRQQVEANTAAIGKAVDEQLKLIKQLNDAAGFRNERAAAADSREAVISPAKKELAATLQKNREDEAIRNARSPEEAEQLRKRFGLQHEAQDLGDQANEKFNKEQDADRDIRNGRETLNDANATAYQIQAQIRDAQQKAAEAKAVVETFRGQPESQRFINARQDAFAAQQNLKELTEKTAPQLAAAAETAKQAQAQIDTANNTKESVALQRQQLHATLAGKLKALAGDGATYEETLDRRAESTALKSAAAPFASRAPDRPGSGGTITRGDQVLIYAAGKMHRAADALDKVGEASTKLGKAADDAKKKADKAALDAQDRG